MTSSRRARGTPCCASTAARSPTARRPTVLTTAVLQETYGHELVVIGERRAVAVEHHEH